MSIQQQLGGQIFSMTEPEHLVVEIDTCFTKAIPSKENIAPESCFAENGLEITHNETLLKTYINDSIDLVTVVPNNAIEQMNRHFSEQKIRIYTPLQKAIELAMKHKTLSAVFYFTKNNLYVAITKKCDLKYAEVFPTTDDSDLLYCISTINVDFDIMNSGKVLITGQNAQEHYKFIKKYIKNCKCE